MVPYSYKTLRRISSITHIDIKVTGDVNTIIGNNYKAIKTDCIPCHANIPLVISPRQCVKRPANREDSLTTR